MNYKNMALGVLAVSAISLALVACSGSGKAPVTQTGQLIDAAVAGVSYTTTPGGLTGTTDASGNYNYLPGDKVTFRIGNIVFPEVDAKGTVTPLDLAGATQVQNGTVVNIARLLQTLDSDSDPSNGITIDSNIQGSAYDFTQDSASFEAAFKADFPNLNLVTQADAVAHLVQELAALNSGGGSVDLPDVIKGKVFDMTYSFVSPGATAPFTQDQAVRFTVSSSGRLFIDTDPSSANGDEITIDTVKKQGQEYIWEDAQSGLSYALSLLSDGSAINEINVNKGGVFQGQFTLAGGGSTATSFSLMGNISGVTGSGGQWVLNIGTAGFHNDGSLINGTVNYGPNTFNDGTSYQVVLTNPSGQNCSVTNGTGMISGSDITNINITCGSSS